MNINPHDYHVRTYSVNVDTESITHAQAILLRIKVANSGIANLLTSFELLQMGHTQGVDIIGYLFPQEHQSQSFEVMLPWDASLPPTISIKASPQMHNNTISTTLTNIEQPQLVTHHSFGGRSHSPHSTHSH